MSWRLGKIEQRLACPYVSDVVHAQMWVLEQVADLVIDVERPVVVKEIKIKPSHSHPNIVLQLTTDDYGSCLLGVPFATQACSVSATIGRSWAPPAQLGRSSTSTTRASDRLLARRARTVESMTRRCVGWCGSATR